MKLAQVHFKPDFRIRELFTALLTASDKLDLSFEGGLVSVRRLDVDEPAYLIPVTNILWMRQAPPDPKGAKKAP